MHESRMLRLLGRTGLARSVLLSYAFDDAIAVCDREKCTRRGAFRTSTWDGRDHAGRLARPGIYLVPLEAEGRAWVGRVVRPE